MAATSGNMETDDLSDTMNDFLPLLPENIKQELFDATEKGNLCDSAENKGDEAETATDPLAPSKCVWCEQILTSNDNPKLLECLHIACNACVQQKITDLSHNSPLTCPVCKMESRIEYIINNVFLSEISTNNEDNPGSVESTKDQIKCSSCNDDANATSWCMECAEFICNSCVQAHQRLKITKEHTIKPKEAACEPNSNGLGGKNFMCQMHLQEKLSLFCETCDRLTCRDCQLLDHRDHKYKFANEIASETRNSLSALLSEISYKKVLLSSAMKVIDDRQAQITEKKKELSKEIADLVVRLTNAVNSRGKQLVYRLNQVCDTKLQVLNEKKEALQLLSGHTDHCIEFVQTALDKGSDNAVLYSKKTLTRHLQKVKSQRADIPNPEIPVRVQLYLSNVPELQTVISRIGTILVDGKVYPTPLGPGSGPTIPPAVLAGQVAPQSRSKQPSPNITPPLRPGMPGPGMTTLSSNGPGGSGTPGGGGGGSVGGGSGGSSSSASAAAAFSQVPPMYNGNGGVPVGGPFPPNHPMNRSFAQENGPGPGPGFGRFPMGPPHGMPPQQHVSSSTHPQNMDPLLCPINPPMAPVASSHRLPSPEISLRNLLNQKSTGPPLPSGSGLSGAGAGGGGGGGGAGGHAGSGAGSHAQANNQFTANTANFMGSGVSPGSSGGGPPSHRLSNQLGGPGNFLGSAGSGHQSFNQPANVGPPNNGGMGMGAGGPAAAAAVAAAARYQSYSRYGVPPSMRHIMGNNSSTLLTPKQQSLRYPGQQGAPGYNPNSPQPPQLPSQHSGASVPGPGVGSVGGSVGSGGSGGGAKWHIPQNMQAQQNNGFGGPSGLHLFGNGPNESFKIPLKSPDTIRNAMLLNGAGGSSGGSLVHGGHGGSGSSSASGLGVLGGPSMHLHHPHHSQQQQLQQQQAQQQSLQQQQHQQQQQQQQQAQQQQQTQQQQQQLHSQQQLQNHLQQLQNALPNVSSTNPKTPSPSTNEPGKDFAESIDKTCEDSVNDLMATIAKLDSNGVQVLPEGHRAKTTSPQVHSSTDLNTSGTTVVTGSNTSSSSAGGSNSSASIVLDVKNLPKDLDPNEDWCAVCMDGGELMCCDKCPKVFHQTCHIPVIDSLPDESETWQCLLCYNFADLPADPTGEKRNVGITPLELKILQRIVLELFCQYETSMPFRQLEPEINKAYYDIVRNPISLTIIREKLEMSNNDHYTDIVSFIADVKRLFDNVYLYYREDHTTYKNARKLEKFFEQQLAKWLPKYLESDCYVDDYFPSAAKRGKNSHQED